MKQVDLQFLEKHQRMCLFVIRTVVLVNTYTSIVIFMNQLAKGFQT